MECDQADFAIAVKHSKGKKGQARLSNDLKNSHLSALGTVKTLLFQDTQEKTEKSLPKYTNYRLFVNVKQTTINFK